MRTCEAGACTKPAVYRGPRDERHAAAWCEEHVKPKTEADFWRVVEPIPGAQQEVKP